MIVSKTPFRITLGGGGTDLPSYYNNHGGFIFSFCLAKYMYVCVNRPSADNLIRLKYSESETVENIKDLNHDIARTCLESWTLIPELKLHLSDIPAGSGLGSSSTYTVGLLNSLHYLKGEKKSLEFLANEACIVEMDMLKKPMGKQDQYLAALGGFVVLEIDKLGIVKSRNINLSEDRIKSKKNLLIFYTGKQRLNKGILDEQDKSTKSNNAEVLNSLHYIKESGYKILEIIETGDLDELGIMFKDHWEMKKNFLQESQINILIQFIIMQLRMEL